MNELVQSPNQGAADTDVGKPDVIDASEGADAMYCEIAEVRDGMRRAIEEARPKPEIAQIFIRASDISAKAAGSEARYKKGKDLKRHAAFREVALRVDLLRAQWLVETEKAKLRFMGRHGEGIKAGTPPPPHLLTLGDLFPRHTQNQARKLSQDLRLLGDMSPEKFEVLVADPTAPRPRSGPEKRVLRLSAIRADERAQPRAALDDDRVAEYAEDMKRGCGLPPPVVFEDLEKVCWLADGFHRYRAAVALKRKTIECIVYQGELRDAVLHGCGANAGHGLRRSNQDKRRAVARMLDDEEWSKWTDSEIARRCKVSRDLVAQLRREQLKSVTCGNASDLRTYTNKHGNTATMNTANIGGKPGKPEASGAEHLISAAATQALREIKFDEEVERRVRLFPGRVLAKNVYQADRRELLAFWQKLPLAIRRSVADAARRLRCDHHLADVVGALPLPDQVASESTSGGGPKPSDHAPSPSLQTPPEPGPAAEPVNLEPMCEVDGAPAAPDLAPAKTDAAPPTAPGEPGPPPDHYGLHCAAVLDTIRGTIRGLTNIDFDQVATIPTDDLLEMRSELDEAAGALRAVITRAIESAAVGQETSPPVGCGVREC